MSNQTARAASDAETRIGMLIRARRRQLGLTLQQLGDAASLSVGYLSQVERDNATPTLGTLAGIARALGVGLDYFVAQPRAEDALTREETRPRFSIAGSSVIYERLGAEFPGNQLSSFILTVPPGYASETVSHEGEELIYILDGSITQYLDGEAMVMEAGDSLHYRGNVPHAWSNPNETPARILWTGTLTLFKAGGQQSARFELVSPDKTIPDTKPVHSKAKSKPRSRKKEE
ncbi:helix-turn-helix domain-containing protein [Nitratireductor sp. ZSWI3]|uniref:helix-turn-helix domain-containing protein n=1 Tax=Nitratireductor sp. ZSWI3 TaxID=2966359 RepID=UPI00214FBCE5|nr:cupin domain-containing protein [Nitratireductor sp. ZSWI3]MCR4266137.1 cupin domain-containing protein [Nitratireductor sp. ZSWI3]